MPAVEPDENERLLYARAVLGEVADGFLKSDIGRYVIHRSLDETKEIILQFKAVDPNDAQAVQALQLKWRVAEQALVWIYEAVHAGKQALSILEATTENQ